MSNPVHWVGVDFDHPPTKAEMENVSDILSDELDNTIITTREVEPMNQEERKEYVRELISALEE